VIHKIQL